MVDKPGRYFDGDGLYLSVKSADLKSWIYCYRGTAGKACEKALGSWPEIKVMAARKLRDAAAMSLQPKPKIQSPSTIPLRIWNSLPLLQYRVDVQSWGYEDLDSIEVLESSDCPKRGYIDRNRVALELRGLATCPDGGELKAVIRVSRAVCDEVSARYGRDETRARHVIEFDVSVPLARFESLCSMVAARSILSSTFGIDSAKGKVMSVRWRARSPRQALASDTVAAHDQRDKPDKDLQDLVPLNTWLKENGISRATAYREISDGDLEVTYVRGGVYLSKNNRSLYVKRKELASKRRRNR